MTAQSILTLAETVELSAGITAAYLSANQVPPEKVPDVLTAIHGAISSIATGGQILPTSQKPAVSIKRSVTKDYIVCLEDGAKLKMLKRYLKAQFDLTPDEYRRKWGLPSDYPMVAPGYSEKRSAAAKASGLGTKRKAKTASAKRAAKKTAATKSKRRSR